MKIGKDQILIKGAATQAVAFKEMPMRKPPLLTKQGKVTHVEMGKLIPGMTTISTASLKAAAPVYHISPDIRDYNFSLIPALVSDIPNVNMQAVPTKELLRFHLETGCMAYKTYVGKCLFSEHDNEHPEKSYGIILDASLKPVPKYGVNRVFILAAYDRTKSPRAARAALDPKTCYSMGLLCPAVQCSICGGFIGPVVTRTCTCYDVADHNDIRNLGKIKNGRLHYVKAHIVKFIEQSIVRVPAEQTCFNGQGL